MISLFEFLEQKNKEVSKSTIRSWIKDKRVVIDGKLRQKGEVSEQASWYLKPKEKRLPAKVKILYQDPHFIVLDKPPSLLSVATDNQPHCLHGILKKIFHKKVYVVHRLDQGTSGVILFALSEEGYVGLKEMFRKHDLKRVYYGIVEGEVEEDEGVFDVQIKEDKSTTMRVVKTGGVQAITYWQKEKIKKGYTLLKFLLQTGKKNQIRVQCQHAGFPITGDKKYGAKKDPIKRLALHAYELSFVHPLTNKPMRFISPVPKKFL